MRAFVAVTDREWFDLLRSLPDIDEVNFWQPSGSTQFRALAPGELFLFKLHSPDNFITGGGFFRHFSRLPPSLAWEAFGEKNGALSLAEMRGRIAKYRRQESGHRAHSDIGCILLQSPFFFSDRDWIPVPHDFAKNIVRGKGYDLTAGVGKELWEQVSLRLTARGGKEIADAEGSPIGDPRLVAQRLGQGTFRVVVTDAYRRRCAITQERALPVLEAAHIVPVSEGGQHRTDNGLLLRSDLHRLFDRGYLTVTPSLRVRVSRRLKDEFDNGEIYYPLEGNELWLPKDWDYRPSREHLEWHADTVFLG